MWSMSIVEGVAFIVIGNAERQACWRAKRDAEIEALRAATTKAELALTQAENHLLRQRVLDLEKALAHRVSAAKSAQTKAASEVVRLKQKDKDSRDSRSCSSRWWASRPACGDGARVLIGLRFPSARGS